MSKLRRVLQSRALDVAAAVITFISVVRIAQVLPSRALSYDFNHYYVSSRLLVEGYNPYRTPLAERSEEYGFEHSEKIAVATNPPLLLWLIAPLTILTPRVAFWVWVAIQASSLVVILWLTRFLLRDQLTPRGWRFLCAGVLSSAPVFWNFSYAHVEMLLVAMLMAAYVWHKGGRHTLACTTVLFLAMVKIYPLVLLPWFIWRDHRVVWKRVLNSVALLAAAAAIVLLTKPALWGDFFAEAMPIIRRWSVGHTFNFTLPSFVINAGQMFCDGKLSPETSKLWWTVGSAFGFVGILAAYIFCVAGGQDQDAQFSVLCAAMLAGGLTAWGYYLVTLVFPVAVALTRVTKPRERVLLGVILVMLNCQGPWDRSLFPHWALGRILLNYVPLYGILGLTVLCARGVPVDGTDRTK